MGPRITTNEQKILTLNGKFPLNLIHFIGLFSSSLEDLQIYLSKVYDCCCECSLFSLIAHQPAASRWSAVTDPSWQLRETIEWSEQRKLGNIINKSG